MLDFWKRMAASQWANHPQVMFELWNESEDIGAHRGGPGSWADQKPAIQETIDAIRAAGARNIIIVPTTVLQHVGRRGHGQPAERAQHRMPSISIANSGRPTPRIVNRS